MPSRSPLERLQREFQDYVLARNGAVLARVAGSDRDEAVIRMNVYADGYVLRLLEALETDYPGLRALAGAEAFDAVGRDYIDAHASAFRNLRWFGHRLAELLGSNPRWSQRPELAEMASFEWAMAASFDAPDAAAMTRDELARVPEPQWPQLTFVAHPAVRRVRLHTNVPRLWSARERGEPLPPLTHEAAPITWLLARRDLQVRFRPMSGDEDCAFEQLAAGADFAAWCGELGSAERAVELLSQWLAEGALAGFTLGDQPSRMPS